MLNKKFNAAVIHTLVNLQTAFFPTAKKPEPSALPYSPDSVVAFVDLQSLHFFLKDNFEIKSNHLHVINFLHEFADKNGLKLGSIRAFSGIHDPAKDRPRYESTVARIQWMERCGAKVFTLPLIYFTEPDTHRTRILGKGIDVLMGSDLVRATAQGLTKAIVFSQDPELCQAIKVAQELAIDAGRELQVYSVAFQGSDGWLSDAKNSSGLDFTTRLPLNINQLKPHVREVTPKEVNA